VFVLGVSLTVPVREHVTFLGCRQPFLLLGVDVDSGLPRPDAYFTTRPSTPPPVRFTGSPSAERVGSSSTTAERRGADVPPTSADSSSTSADSSSTSARRKSSRRFTLSQLVVAVVVTHIVTLLFYVVVAAVCYWRRCSGDELARRRRRVHHQRSTFCSGSSASTAASAKLTSLPQSPSGDAEAAVCLNGLAAARHRHLFFEAAASYRFRDGEYG